MTTAGMARGAVVLALLLGAGLAAAWTGQTQVLGAWLAAWWFALGLSLGALVNVWVHSLTGGRWGEAIRPDALRLGAAVWPLAVLFVPVLAGMNALYPWASDAARGSARWAGELASHSTGFKNLWLTPWCFVLRGVMYLALWSLLARLTMLPACTRSPRFAAVALIVYGVSVSLAAVDWLMSLMPLWYSSVFGLLAACSQAMSGLAAAVVLCARRAGAGEAQRLGDLGNLLLMYLMTWAYLSFTQYLIIWGANLPHEISWYVVRRDGGWLPLAWALAVLQFALPLVVLLFRRAKRAPRVLAGVAGVLLLAQLLAAWWLVLPSVPAAPLAWWWLAPVVALVFAAAARTAVPRGWAMPVARGTGSGGQHD